MKTVKISDPEQIEKYYNEAKCIFSKDKKKAIALINQLPLDYFEGFMAFTDAIEKKEDLIHNRIIIIKTAYQLDMDDVYKHTDRLFRVAHSIVCYYPDIVLDICHYIETISDDRESTMKNLNKLHLLISSGKG